MSRCAVRESRTSKRRERRSGTTPPGCEFGCGFFSKSIDKVVDLLASPQGHIVAALNVVESFFRGGAEPFDFGLVFPLALFKQAETLADHFAGVAEAAGGEASLDETVEMFGEVDVAGFRDNSHLGHERFDGLRDGALNMLGGDQWWDLWLALNPDATSQVNGRTGALLNLGFSGLNLFFDGNSATPVKHIVARSQHCSGFGQ